MLYGKITEFNKANEDWVNYVKRMTMFFEGNRIEEEMKKKATFQSSVEART